MKKLILKVHLQDERLKQKAMKSVSGLPGVESISMNMKDQKLDVIGDVNPVDVVKKLKKLCSTEILSVEPAKEEKKTEKEEPKKDKEEKEPEKEKPKKDEKRGDVDELMKAYQAYNPYMNNKHGFVSCTEGNPISFADENPNSCVIC